MTFTPWAHQTRAVDEARRAYAAGARSILIIAPTGAGKTMIGAMVARGGTVRKRRALWIVPRRELVEQSRAKLADLQAEAHVTTIQQLTVSGERPAADIVFLDEARHYVAAEWHTVAASYAHALRIGLDATPERGDRIGLGDLFTHSVVAATYSELIAGGMLVPADVRCFTDPARQTRTLSMPVRDAIARWAPDTRAIVFSATVPEAKALASEIPRCAAITDRMPAKARREAIAAFHAGEILRLASVHVLTEGFDERDVRLVVLARPFGNVSTYLQACGRGLRACPETGKAACVIADLCGNVHAYGFPDRDRVYSLTGEPISRRGEGDPPLWQCKSCGYPTERPPADRRCENCGAPLPVPEALRVRARKMEQISRETTFGEDEWTEQLRRLEKVAQQRGYKPGWARAVMDGQRERARKARESRSE